MYALPLWHFWVENAHGGTCMNCSFRRMKLEFSSEAVCYYLMVTVHCGPSCWYICQLRRFEVTTSHKCNLIFSYIFKSFSLSVSVGFRLRALNPIILVTKHNCLSDSDFSVKLNISFVQHESQTFLNPHWTIRKPGLCFSSEIIDLFWDLIWDKSLVLSFKIPNL